VAEHLPVDNEAMVGLVQRYQPDVLKKVAFTGATTVERARWLLEQGVDCKSADWLGVTPLHRLAIDGKLDMAALCLEFGADVNAVDDNHASTPLGWAARGGRFEMVEWLLGQGADPRLPADQTWAWPIEWARRQGHDGIVRLLDGR
jgi:ankyrin repeat protein